MYSLIKAQLQLENDDPNIYIKDKKELKYFAITIIVFFSDYHEWVNSYKNRESYHTYSKLYRGDSDIWCCRSESEQGLIRVTNDDTPLDQAANFWLDIVIYWR